MNMGRNDKAFRIMITINRKTPNVPLSILSVPADAGTHFFFNNNPAKMMAPLIGINLPNSIAAAVVRFQNTVLFPRPPKLDPFPATEETYS